MQARAILVLCAALAGCWQGGQGVEVTSLDHDLVIGNLTDPQFSKLCGDIDHWNQAQFGSDRFRATACEITAAATLREQSPVPELAMPTCHAMAQQCASAGGPAITRECQRDPGCRFPISRIEDCLFEISYDMNQVLCTAPICDDICSAVDPRAVEPPSCAAIQAACPQLRFTRPSFDFLVQLDPCSVAGPRTRQCVWHN